MKLFQYKSENDGKQVGIKIDDNFYNFTKMDSENKFNSIIAMVEKNSFNKKYIDSIINKINVEDFQIKEDVIFDIPTEHCPKILCYGVNYKAHAEESNNPVPEQPIIFSKTPNTLLPHNGTITFPENIGYVDHEIELAVVIGKNGKNISEDEAAEYVAGYTIINDISARKMQIDDLGKSHPWFRSKSYDTFCPIGPYLVPADAISDPNNLDLTLKINGTVKQHSNTSRLIFDIPRLISFASDIMTLNVGDIICTGTPDGISKIVDGDVVTCEISELGLLSNPVKVV